MSKPTKNQSKKTKKWQFSATIVVCDLRLWYADSTGYRTGRLDLITSVIIIKTELNVVVRENWAVLAWPNVYTSDERDQSINLTSFQGRIGTDLVGVPSVWVQASCISLSCSLNLSWIGPPCFLDVDLAALVGNPVYYTIVFCWDEGVLWSHQVWAKSHLRLENGANA